MDGKAESLYRVGIYVRESRDDNEEKYETIETQRDLLIDFVKRNGFGEIYSIYIDDNVSGSGFEREGLEKLKEDVVSNRVNLIVLKDLSRLGRNNAKTLLFLDFLEERSVRVLTFDGKYDSMKDNDTVGIETWVNERYIKDISKKIRTNLRFKIEKGEYIGRAPFGYIKSIEQKNKLCIDSSNASVVKEIFKLYKQGYGYSSIVKYLNERGYPSPSANHGFETSVNTWNQVAIQRILSNRVYVGDTIQGVSEKISFKSKKTRRLPENRWVVTPHTHEAIIDEDEFEEVQKIRESRRKGLGHHKGTLHLLRGLIYCGRCGSSMFARSRINRPMGYICSNYMKNGASACTSHHLSERYIIEILVNELVELLSEDAVKSQVKSRLEKNDSERIDHQQEIEKLQQQILEKQKQQDILYMDRLEGKISEQLFIRMNHTIENRISNFKRELERNSTYDIKTLGMEKIMEQFEEYILENGLTHQMVISMVDRIMVFDKDDDIHLDTEEEKYEYDNEDGAIIINFKFNRELNS